MPAIKIHHTATADDPWDGPAMETRCPAEEGPLRASHVWVESGADPSKKSSYRFIHHEIGADGKVGPANLTACSAGIGVLNGGRGGTTIPDADKNGVYAHLAAHLKDADRMPPKKQFDADSEALAVGIEPPAAAPEVTLAAPAPAMPDQMPMPGDGQPQDMRRFHIPIGVVEGAATSDNRDITPQATIWRDPPLPLMATDRAPHGNMPVTDAQHIGKITAVGRRDVSGEPDRLNGGTYPDGSYAVFGSGEFDMDNPDAADFARRVYAGMLNTVSADLIAHMMEMAAGDDPAGPGEETMTSVELLGFTIVPHSAFAGCFIVGDDGQGNPLSHPGDLLAEGDAEPALPLAAGGTPVPWILHEQPYSPRRCLPCEAASLTASAAPVEPPLDWFMDPQLDQPTGITITDEGRVFGHLADWTTCHTGISGRCVRPPHSATGYAVFRTGAVKCSDGTLVAVGQLTVGTGHADTSRGTDAMSTIRHYDDTGTAVADVSVGEDTHGIWVAGALRPEATPEQIRVLRASPLSGDWRPWGDSLELVAALAVNVQGFPVLREVVASGRTSALIAAGPPPADLMDEVRDLLPTLTAAADRERRAQAAEMQARTARVTALQARTRNARRARNAARLATLTKEPTR